MTDTQTFCKSCRKPKAPYICGVCEEHVCKACTQFLSEENFSFLKVIPPELKHNSYCPQCFDEKVSGPLADYEETLEKAREIFIFSKDQTKQTRLVQRKEAPYSVENCEDQEEAVMKMSFWAVKAGFNALVDLQYQHKKIIVGSHKKTIWSATAIPVTIDPKRIDGHEELQ